MIDWEKERARLTHLYARMEDGELEKIGANPDSLTAVARHVLGAEMLKRGMKLPEPPPSRVEVASPVAIQRYRDLPQAAMAQSILESAGIESFLADANLVRMDWFYSNAIGGIKVVVREEDAEEARKILGQQIPESIEVEGSGHYEQPRCPKCGSFDISLDALDNRVRSRSLWMGMPVRPVVKGWSCGSCDHHWNDEADSEGPPQKD
jgi:Putative prokaryotic signal transducing protein